MRRGHVIVGAMSAIWAARNPAKKSLVLPLSVDLYQSLNSIRTYVRLMCEWDHMSLEPLHEPWIPGQKAWNQAKPKRG